LNKLGHFVGFHQIGNHENFIFTKKVARQPYFVFLFSNSPLNSTTGVKKLENSMKGLLLWKTVENALPAYAPLKVPDFSTLMTNTYNVLYHNFHLKPYFYIKLKHIYFKYNNLWLCKHTSVSGWKKVIYSSRPSNQKSIPSLIWDPGSATYDFPNSIKQKIQITRSINSLQTF